MPTLQSLTLAIPLVIFSASLAAVAQTTPATHQITLTVQAATSKGEPVKGLTAADFHLLDNKSPRPINAAKELPTAAETAELFIVVDSVNIDYTRVAYVREEIAKFLTLNGGKLAHPTTFVMLSDKGPQIQQGFSTDGNMLAAALKTFPFGLREIRRDTGIWGADERSQISINALRLLISHATPLPGRKLILWISPGWPLLSGPGIQLQDKQQQTIFSDIVSLSTQMRQGKVTLYNINPLGPGEGLVQANYYEDFVKGIKKASEVDLADLSLQVLSVQSGGRTFISNSDVTGNLTKAAADADSWYELTFTGATSEKPDEYHHVQIEVSRPGTTGRTRDGYYAQP